MEKKNYSDIFSDFKKVCGDIQIKDDKIIKAIYYKMVKNSIVSDIKAIDRLVKSLGFITQEFQSSKDKQFINYIIKLFYNNIDTLKQIQSGMAIDTNIEVDSAPELNDNPPRRNVEVTYPKKIRTAEEIMAAQQVRNQQIAKKEDDVFFEDETKEIPEDQYEETYNDIKEDIPQVDIQFGSEVTTEPVEPPPVASVIEPVVAAPPANVVKKRGRPAKEVIEPVKVEPQITVPPTQLSEAELKAKIKAELIKELGLDRKPTVEENRPKDGDGRPIALSPEEIEAKYGKAKKKTPIDLITEEKPSRIQRPKPSRIGDTLEGGIVLEPYQGNMPKKASGETNLHIASKTGGTTNYFANKKASEKCKCNWKGNKETDSVKDVFDNKFVLRCPKCRGILD
jgi:hypothetical protein